MTGNRFASSPSSGSHLTLGCGQSVPHRMRSGAAAMSEDMAVCVAGERRRLEFHLARARNPAGLEKLLQRLAAERRYHVRIGDSLRPRQLLEAEEAGAVVHEGMPIQISYHLLFFFCKVCLLHGFFGIFGERLSLGGDRQRMQKSVKTKAFGAKSKVKDVGLHSNSATAIAVVIGR